MIGDRPRNDSLPKMIPFGISFWLYRLLEVPHAFYMSKVSFYKQDGQNIWVIPKKNVYIVNVNVPDDPCRFKQMYFKR